MFANPRPAAVTRPSTRSMQRVPKDTDGTFADEPFEDISDNHYKAAVGISLIVGLALVGCGIGMFVLTSQAGPQMGGYDIRWLAFGEDLLGKEDGTPTMLYIGNILAGVMLVSGCFHLVTVLLAWRDAQYEGADTSYYRWELVRHNNSRRFLRELVTLWGVLWFYAQMTGEEDFEFLFSQSVLLTMSIALLYCADKFYRDLCIRVNVGGRGYLPAIKITLVSSFLAAVFPFIATFIRYYRVKDEPGLISPGPIELSGIIIFTVVFFVLHAASGLRFLGYALYNYDSFDPETPVGKTFNFLERVAYFPAWLPGVLREKWESVNISTGNVNTDIMFTVGDAVIFLTAAWFSYAPAIRDHASSGV